MQEAEQSISNMVSSLDLFEELVVDLQPEQWTVQSLCPDWTVKGVVEHIVGIERILIDWRPTSAESPPPFDQIGSFLAEAANLNPRELVELTKRTFADRRQNLADYGLEVAAEPCMTPVGPGTYGSFMDVRTFDVWVHHRDITSPLGLSTNDGGPAAEAVLDQVHNSLGYIVGKKIGMPDGSSIEINVSGPIERTLAAVVDGRAQVVESVESPTVTLDAEALSFIQLACGRIDPEAEIAAGRIRWSGDEELGAKAARSLAFTR